MSSWPEIVLEAHKVSLKMLEHSYAPYSQLHVGAALKVKGHDELISGCNVENASFGATLCAERVAVFHAIARIKKPELEFMVLCSDSPQGLIPPCGMCLQVLQEFVRPDFPIYLADQKGVQKKLLFKECLPNQFEKHMLPES